MYVFLWLISWFLPLSPTAFSPEDIMENLLVDRCDPWGTACLRFATDPAFPLPGLDKAFVYDSSGFRGWAVCTVETGGRGFHTTRCFEICRLGNSWGSFGSSLVSPSQLSGCSTCWENHREANRLVQFQHTQFQLFAGTVTCGFSHGITEMFCWAVMFLHWTPLWLRWSGGVAVRSCRPAAGAQYLDVCRGWCLDGYGWFLEGNRWFLDWIGRQW